ncbi:LysR substrate-binding domain-containing protein [Actinoallomurus spadix]|uniref:LysR family transcriptional regulator n=1 Tax=Actinoallomurus spadix TaxID=79912 RepID=A0ABP3HI04_9ACTN|nr:LysR substrate-binding domain-containing protein [Actinoallomurus spadix]MCO5988451.1 LysR substrate-binding domain-containing protein [Actinoallomurus spadix]
MFDPRQLQVLLEVARTGTYTAAAAALGYTQPAVSYQMRMLERAAETPLTVKAGRNIKLTNAGRILARQAEVVLAALRAAEDELAPFTSTTGGRVHLSAVQSGCVSLVPAALAKLRRTHPDLEVILTQAECAVSRELLAAGQVELSLMCDVVDDPVADDVVSPDPRMLRIPLMTDRRCVLLPADHPAAAAPSVALADLAGEHWVLETQRSRFLAACQTAGFVPKVAATSDDQLTIHSLVAKRIGVAVINELGLTARHDPLLVARPLDGWPRRRIFLLLWPEMIRVPHVRALVDALRAAAEER